MMTVKRVLVVATSLSFLSCSHTQKTEKFKQDVSRSECESAYVNIPENSEGLKFIRKTQEASGTALHYAASGAGYAAQYTAYVTAGLLTIVVACAPAALAHSGECIPLNVMEPHKYIPKIGKNTADATAHWSCANLNPLSRQVRQVAACFRSRNTKEDRMAAHQTLENFSKSEDVFRCLSSDERENLIRDLNTI
ncbi:MAG: hypothetical protein KDD38_11485 [Bdellovibrionales bacterium]|nr:hypothetical protein [Bdellovibrionales bacterium]